MRSRSPVMVTDNGEPTKWYLPNLPRDRRTSEDYAVVSRVFHPDTHRMLVGISGITQYGTEAASDLVTRPDLLADALRTAPAGWERKPAVRIARQSYSRRRNITEGCGNTRVVIRLAARSTAATEPELLRDELGQPPGRIDARRVQLAAAETPRVLLARRDARPLHATC